MTVDGTMPRHTVIDLFAGCGGLTSGFRETGHFEAVAAVESDVAAASTYILNHGAEHMFAGKIEDWLASGKTLAADVVVGGPPCQGFSNLGRRETSDPRNILWQSYVDALLISRPRVFLLENVDRFWSSPEMQSLRNETRPGGRLEDYVLDSEVVRAVDHGAAQNRRRTIVIGTHRDLPAIAIPRGRRPRTEWRTVKEALDGLERRIPQGRTLLPDRSVAVLGHDVPGAFTADELHITRHYTRLSLERFAHIGPGGNRLDLPEALKARCWVGHDRGSMDVLGRLSWDRPSVTIRTEFFKPEKGRYLHPEEPRALSHHEAARLQGFSDDYRWCGTKIQIARQIGNAVPVPLARSLAQHIHDHLVDQR